MSLPNNSLSPSNTSAVTISLEEMLSLKSDEFAPSYHLHVYEQSEWSQTMSVRHCSSALMKKGMRSDAASFQDVSWASMVKIRILKSWPSFLVKDEVLRAGFEHREIFDLW